MTTRLLSSATLGVFGTLTAFGVQAEPVFNRIASFPVPLNLPNGMDQDTETSAEIIQATEDGMTLVYTDSPLGAIGIIDITDPASPVAGGVVSLGGEPTSIAVADGNGFVGVNTSESYTEPSGRLAIIDIAAKTSENSCDLGGQPDSVAIDDEGLMLAIAIENERDEDLNDGMLPQLPAGYVMIIPVNDGVPDCGSSRKVEPDRSSRGRCR